MASKFFRVVSLVLIICLVLGVWDYKPARAEHLHSTSLATSSAMSKSRTSKKEANSNYTSDLSRDKAEGNFHPDYEFPRLDAIDPTDIVTDGFNKGRVTGYFSGRAIRKLGCQILELDCS